MARFSTSMLLPQIYSSGSSEMPKPSAALRSAYTSASAVHRASSRVRSTSGTSPGPAPIRLKVPYPPVLAQPSSQKGELPATVNVSSASAASARATAACRYSASPVSRNSSAAAQYSSSSRQLSPYSPVTMPGGLRKPSAAGRP
ncbi:hypothetical protein D3C75_999690 [compost metagenome]